MVGWHHRLNGHRFGWTLGLMDREAWHAVVHRVTKIRTRLSNCTEQEECLGTSTEEQG